MSCRCAISYDNSLTIFGFNVQWWDYDRALIFEFGVGATVAIIFTFGRFPQ
jgi:hypothetical protein